MCACVDCVLCSCVQNAVCGPLCTLLVMVNFMCPLDWGHCELCMIPPVSVRVFLDEIHM